MITEKSGRSGSMDSPSPPPTSAVSVGIAGKPPFLTDVDEFHIRPLRLSACCWFFVLSQRSKKAIKRNAQLERVDATGTTYFPELRDWKNLFKPKLITIL